MEIISVRKVKRPIGWGRWQAYVLDADEYGTWAYTPAGSIFTSDDGSGVVSSCEVARDGDGRGRHSVLLLRWTAWFVASWALDAPLVATADICTPPTRSGTDWVYQDLELDPFLRLDGTFGVEDEDEFAAACAAGLINDSERDAARAATELLRSEMAHLDTPFIRAGLSRLVAAAALGLPLLTDDQGGSDR